LATQRRLSLLALVAVLALGLSACYPVYGGGVRVGFGPPGFRAEVAVESPGPGYYWVPGYYDWVGGNYVWVTGRWVRPPHERAVWVAPRYERRGRGYVYYRGHWDDGGRRDRDRDRH
jgi:hypothetical protein